MGTPILDSFSKKKVKRKKKRIYSLESQKHTSWKGLTIGVSLCSKCQGSVRSARDLLRPTPMRGKGERE